MEKTIRIKTLLCLSIAILLINGCTKDGATGPAGPQGPQGSSGNSGSSNVSSATFSMTSWLWSTPYYYRNLSMPELTTNNIDSALVMVYFSKGGAWIAVPYTQYDSPYDYFMGFNTSIGNVQVTWFYDFSGSNGSDPNAYFGTTVKCKVVVIPPAHRKANPNINWKNYSEVKAKFNLID